MSQYLIMCKSLTYAQRSQRLLERAGISSYIIKAPLYLRSGGCGYAISLHRDFDRAVYVLKEASLLRGRLYQRKGEADIWEAVL